MDYKLCNEFPSNEQGIVECTNGTGPSHSSSTTTASSPNASTVTGSANNRPITTQFDAPDGYETSNDASTGTRTVLHQDNPRYKSEHRGTVNPPLNFVDPTSLMHPTVGPFLGNVDNITSELHVQVQGHPVEIMVPDQSTEGFTSEVTVAPSRDSASDSTSRDVSAATCTQPADPGAESDHDTTADGATLDQEANSTHAEASNRVGLRCPYSYCRYGGTFARQDSLQRHIKSTHGQDATSRWICPLTSCMNGINRTALSRKDVLVRHIRTAHRGAKFQCPSGSCSQRKWQHWELLWAHLRKAHQSEKLDEIAALTTAVDPGNIACPIWLCRERLSLSAFQDHLMQHTQGDLATATETLLSENYAVIKASCEHATTGGSTSSASVAGCACDITSIAIICPVCGHPCTDHRTFRSHLQSQHLLKQGEDAHYEAWKHYAQATATWTKKQDFNVLQAWRVLDVAQKELQCPSCDYATDPNRNCIVDHHLDMLVGSEVLRPYRCEILKLYPGFVDYKIWSDTA